MFLTMCITMIYDFLDIVNRLDFQIKIKRTWPWLPLTPIWLCFLLSGRRHEGNKSNFRNVTFYTRAVCKVRGLILLLRVGTLWRCGDGLFFGVPPLTSDSLLTTLHPLLENVLQTVDSFEISYFGAPFSWLEKPRNLIGWDLNCMADVLMGFHRSTFPSRTQNSIQISPHAISGLFQT
jgi:hypothetical protein